MFDTLKKIRILWFAPNLNHYKIGLLNQFALDDQIDLTVCYGFKHDGIEQNRFQFKSIAIPVAKKDFGSARQVRIELKHQFNQFDMIMIPVEKKNLRLFLYAMRLRKHHKTTKLISYNHPVIRSGNGRVTLLDKCLTKFFFSNLDQVVFYTEQSCSWAISKKLIKADKAYWANNTIDDSEISKYNTDGAIVSDSKSIVYIGKLTKRKRISELITYYQRLKKEIPNLKLDIIGDGEENESISKIERSDTDVIWHGKLTSQEQIAPIMNSASFVFVPGHSGLSVNHAFLYGKPYMTLQGPSHAPEIAYIEHGINGYVLDGDFESNIKMLVDVLKDHSILENFSNNARIKGQYLSTENWIKQMKTALINEG